MSAVEDDFTNFDEAMNAIASAVGHKTKPRIFGRTRRTVRAVKNNTKWLEVGRKFTKYYAKEYLQLTKRFPDGQHAVVLDLDSKNIQHIGVLGDAGTHDAVAEEVMRQLKLRLPSNSMALHLGDIYLSGAEEEVRAFVAQWARTLPNVPSLAIPGNHEMYSAGGAFARRWLKHAPEPSPFELQFAHVPDEELPPTFWALYNAHWLILGLDSAFWASTAFRKGAIAPRISNAEARRRAKKVNTAQNQVRWIESVVERLGTNRAIVVMTHHNALKKNLKKTKLYNEVMEAIGRKPNVWYWGHQHRAIVFRQQDDGVFCRCMGHGAYVESPRAVDPKLESQYLWSEQRIAHSDTTTTSQPRLTAGGLVLNFEQDSTELHERFFDEYGVEQFHGTFTVSTTTRGKLTVTHTH